MLDFLTDPLAWGSAVSLLSQWVKSFPWWRNSWCKVAAPIFGVLIGLAAAMVQYGFTPLDAVNYGKEVWNFALNGLLAGGGAVLGYDVQKSFTQRFNLPQLIPAGPDNHPKDQVVVATTPPARTLTPPVDGPPASPLAAPPPPPPPPPGAFAPPRPPVADRWASSPRN